MNRLCLVLLAIACSKAGPTCNFAVTGAVTLKGTCTASALYDPQAGDAGVGRTSLLIKSPYALSPDGLSFSGGIVLAEGKGFGPGTYTGVRGGGGTFGVEVADGGLDFQGTRGPSDMTLYEGDVLLNLTSAGTPSDQQGLSVWTGLSGSLSATLDTEPFVGQRGSVAVQVNLAGDAEPLPAPSGGGTVTLSGGTSGTLSIDKVSAHSVAGTAELEIRASGLADGGTTALVFAMQAGELRAATYTPADVTTAVAFVNDVGREWIRFPASSSGSFTLTLSSLGTPAVVNGITTYTGLHGSLSATVIHYYGVIEDVTVSGSF